jgi:hypothetical protein
VGRGTAWLAAVEVEVEVEVEVVVVVLVAEAVAEAAAEVEAEAEVAAEVAAEVVAAAAPRVGRALRSRYGRYTRRRHPLQRAHHRLGVTLLRACSELCSYWLWS